MCRNALYDPATGAFYLRNSLSSGPPNHVLRFGPSSAGWVPLAGKWLLSTGTTGLMAAEQAMRELLGEAEVRHLSASADGGRIVFATAAAFVAQDTSGLVGVWSYSVLTNAPYLIIHGLGRHPADDLSKGPHLDGAGVRVVFVSEASNLVADDTNGVADVFVHALESGKPVRVTTCRGGPPVGGAVRLRGPQDDLDELIGKDSDEPESVASAHEVHHALRATMTASRRDSLRPQASAASLTVARRRFSI